MEKEFFEILLGTIEKLSREYSFEKVAFAGYGPISNIAALLYSQQFENAYALVTDDFMPELDYQHVLDRYRNRVNYPLFRDLLLERFNSARVKEYAHLKNRPRVLTKIDYLLDQSFLLQKIDLEKTEEWMRKNEA